MFKDKNSLQSIGMITNNLSHTFFESRKRNLGRSSLHPEIHKLIQDMARANPLWGAPLIHGELMKLGIDVHERTVSNIIKRLRTGKPPSQTWKTFLENHMCNTFAVDFFCGADCNL
jgi:putative transposase